MFTCYVCCTCTVHVCTHVYRKSVHIFFITKPHNRTSRRVAYTSTWRLKYNTDIYVLFVVYIIQELFCNKQLVLQSTVDHKSTMQRFDHFEFCTKKIYLKLPTLLKPAPAPLIFFFHSKKKQSRRSRCS